MRDRKMNFVTIKLDRLYGIIPVIVVKAVKNIIKLIIDCL